MTSAMREKVELQMRESENKLRIILDNSAAAITMTDEKERIISWNSFADEITVGRNKDTF